MKKHEPQPVTEDITIPIEAMGGSMIRLQIDPQRVNEIIASAILASGIGDRVRKAAEEFIGEPRRGYGDPIAQAVHDECKKVMREILLEEPFKTKLREMIRAALTDDLADNFIWKVTEKLAKSSYI